jgi:hypothetical protein
VLGLTLLNQGESDFLEILRRAFDSCHEFLGLGEELLELLGLVLDGRLFAVSD